MIFEGFSPKAAEFLAKVAENDSKEWYKAHRDDYIAFVRDPFYNLVLDLTPFMRRLDPQIITEPKSCLSRIYRDTRFTKDKHLYRNTAWICFRRPAEESLSCPAFFVEISPYWLRFGMGAYESGSKAMASLRDFIAAKPDEFRKTVSEIEKDPELFALGEKYKRLPKGCPEGFEEWYSLRGFYICSPEYPLSSADATLPETLEKKFAKIAPLYTLLCDLEAQRAERDNTAEKTMIRQQFEW